MDQGLQAKIFNFDAFQEQLASGKPAIPLFKSAMADAQSVMDEEFRASLDAVTLVHARSWFMDNLLKAAWLRFFQTLAAAAFLVAFSRFPWRPLSPGRGPRHR